MATIEDLIAQFPDERLAGRAAMLCKSWMSRITRFERRHGRWALQRTCRPYLMNFEAETAFLGTRKTTIA